MSLGIGLRGAAVTALVTAGALGMGGTAYAASADGTNGLPQRRTAAAATPEEGTADYRGVQGNNLCLLSQCTVGGGPDRQHAPAPGSPVFRGVQGFNLCLLAVCRVG